MTVRSLVAIIPSGISTPQLMKVPEIVVAKVTPFVLSSVTHALRAAMPLAVVSGSPPIYDPTLTLLSPDPDSSVAALTPIANEFDAFNWLHLSPILRECSMDFAAASFLTFAPRPIATQPSELADVVPATGVILGLFACSSKGP
jgi:hypothetical protein